MSVTAVVGLNWGDEAKGRMVDYFAAKADCVIRYQGGDNAGHTVINDLGKFAFHNFPSGICYPHVLNIIGPGSVLHPESFIREMQELQSKGLKAGQILISDRAVLILPFHIQIEKLEEERLQDKKYGSTLSGIAPAYGAKFLKKAIQAGELLHPEYLAEHLSSVLEYYNLVLEKVYCSSPFPPEEMYRWLLAYGRKLAPYIADIRPIVSKLLADGRNLILEAQLGALRDITHGIYPYTTSSSTLAGYACASVPIAPAYLREIVGVTKAYSTCVGEGPFVTELLSPLADEIRIKGKEFGAKTGRPRRIGWFDAIATRYGCRLQGATRMVVSCLDVLSGLPELKLCTGYEAGGAVHTEFPINAALMEAKPIYETLPGWDADISEIRDYEALPGNAKRYIEKIEQLVGCPVKYISVGPKREALILR